MESDVDIDQVMFGARAVPYVDKFGVLAKLHPTSIAPAECGTCSHFATTINRGIRRWQSGLWFYSPRNGDYGTVGPLLDRGDRSRPSLQSGISPVRPECAS